MSTSPDDLERRLAFVLRPPSAAIPSERELGIGVGNRGGVANVIVFRPSSPSTPAAHAAVCAR